jgi:hypothetical protein
MTSIIVFEKFRTPVTTEKRVGGGVVHRGPGSIIILNASYDP